jgi:hypothetical protein
MNGFTENRTSGASEKAGRRDVVLPWITARRMLPLVRRIVDEIRSLHRRVGEMMLEKAILDKRRRSLAWPDRSRRYRLGEEIAAAECGLEEARAELADLGLTLQDADDGRVGFPTRVNDRPAFFSWQPSEETVQFWHFAEEAVRRPVPLSWTSAAEPALNSKSR